MRSREGAAEARGVMPAPERVRQFLLPTVAGMAAAKQDLLGWVQELGVEAGRDRGGQG